MATLDEWIQEVINESNNRVTAKINDMLKEQCAGTYHVSGYTRDDGVKVSDYWRTCGASHNGTNPNYGKITGGASSVDNKNLSKILSSVYNDYKGFKNPLNTAMSVLGTFLTNYLEMKNANTIGADKYFHAKANYESAQQGMVGELFAKMISDLREISDFYRNVHEKGLSIEDSKKDSMEDQKANEEGRILGRKHSEPAQKRLKYLMPKGLPERYKN